MRKSYLVCFAELSKHQTNQYLNNHLEQHYRGVKQRHYPMRGFNPSTPLRIFAAPLMRRQITFAPIHVAEKSSPRVLDNGFIGTGPSD